MDHCRENLFTSTPDETCSSDTKSVLCHKGYYLYETTIKFIKDHLNIANDISL